MKKLIRSGLLLVAVAAVVAGGTGAFFSDTETSSGNVFTAGTIDLMVNHTEATYNGESCVVNCNPTGGNLIENGSFENPTVNDNGGAYQFFSSIPDWTLSAGSFIELQGTAFASADGSQHVELDGDGDNPATTIAQTIATVPGERYRLSFAHSPRPESQASDSGIRLEVEVVSPGSIVFSDTINTGSGSVAWSTYTYEFVADDVTTTVRFAYEGTANTYGGLLDNVQVFQLACDGGEYADTPGGFCELWESKDLTNESFFDFSDIKPQDNGTNLISMTVESNESYLCLAVDNKQELENSHTDAEIAAGDMTDDEGEMGQFLTVAGWYSDANGSKGDSLFAPTVAADLETIAFADSATTYGPVQPGVVQYAHLEWCMGEMTVSGTSVTCDGNVPDINQTQTDAFLADLQFHAIQTRNNDDFTCAGYLGTGSATTSNEIGCTEQADVMLVLDSSGSVSPSEITTLKNRANQFVDLLDPTESGVNVGVVDFDLNATLVQGLTGVEGDIINGINSISSGGQTNLEGGIRVAQAELDNGRAGVPKFMLIITDGQPTRSLDANGNPTSSGDHKQDAADAANDSIQAGTEIFAIGVGISTTNANYLRDEIVSDDSSDHYFNVGNFEEINAAFTGILSCDIPA